MGVISNDPVMRLLVALGLMLALGPTRRALVAHWKACLPGALGAFAGYYAGQVVFGQVPGLSWVPWAWAVVAGYMAGKEGKRLLEDLF